MCTFLTRWPVSGDGFCGWFYRGVEFHHWQDQERSQISGAGESSVEQGLSQDLETACPKLAIVEFWGVQIFKGNHNIHVLRFQP